MRDQLEPLLVWATPHQRGFPRNNSTKSHVVPGAPVPRVPNASASSVAGPSSQRRPAGMTPAQTKAHNEAIRKQQESLQKAAELKSMLNNLEKVDDEGRRESLLDTLCSTDDILNLPLHPNPPGTKNGQLVIDLLKHQVRRGRHCHGVLSLWILKFDAESSLAMVHRTRVPSSPKEGIRQTGSVLANATQTQ